MSGLGASASQAYLIEAHRAQHSEHDRFRANISSAPYLPYRDQHDLQRYSVIDTASTSPSASSCCSAIPSLHQERTHTHTITNGMIRAMLLRFLDRHPCNTQCMAAQGLPSCSITAAMGFRRLHLLDIGLAVLEQHVVPRLGVKELFTLSATCSTLQEWILGLPAAPFKVRLVLCSLNVTQRL